MQVLGWKPFASTFAAFLTRAYDFVRMAAISRANLKLCGSHAGVSIGEDGPSQMALEDLAEFRAVHGSTVLYPCDGNQTAKLVRAMADLDGISYLRTTRGEHAGALRAGRGVPGRRQQRRCAEGDDVAIVAAGITVHEALEAADALAADGISARVIDRYSVKPIDADDAARRLGDGPIVTVEDHWPEGGLGEAVLAAFADARRAPRVVKLAVRELPRLGQAGRAAAAAGIDADAIADAARRLVREEAAVS